jgi:disulfide oxidoreductase YuzD
MRIILDRKWRLSFLIVLTVLTLGLTGCGDNDPDTDGDDGDDAPVVPPAYTLVPDFTDMGGQSGASLDEAWVTDAIRRLPDAENDGVSIQASCPTDNYTHAAIQVGFWNSALFLTLAVPTLSFAEALHHDPVQRDDGSWVWSYSVTIGNILYTAELHGEFVDDEVHWAMYITKQGSYEDFLWYSGTSNLPATAGTWTLKKSHAENYDWIGIEWSRSIANQTWQVQYMNIHEDDDNEGGFIEYGVIDDDTYDAFYDVYNAVADNLVEIDSNRTSKAGRVRNEVFFEDTEWHHWDGNHCNSVTP